ncbi:ankyrin repeat protein [Colletotrichum navitas]|uniref:Ankyrin repeat protein n=1 Tax=Colletotrichum navitas TaxID=681940 RepID=A0AAD8PUB0_9PEZI|nr:ankyrin repeat protein [Colletotrichum navitas]KAK1580142.1 ankyrin repeat protein [Colletotrichum navitas]
MAEVLTVLEVALCITEVVERLCVYVSAVRSAKDDIRKLTQELLALKGAMEYFDAQNKKNVDGPLQEQAHSMLTMAKETIDAVQQKLGTPKASSVGRAVQSLAWPFRAGGVDKYLVTLERAKAWFIMVLMRDSLDATSSVLVEMQKLTALIHEEIITRNTDRMLQETADLLKWLSPVSSEDKLAGSRQDRAPGTGNWIRDRSYLAWQKDGPTQQPIFWITGRSGSGKTVLFSHLVDELRKRPSADPSAKTASIGVGFHCCSLDDAASQAVPNVFGSILAQIAATTPEILDYVRPLRTSGSTLIPQNNLTVHQIFDVMREALSHFHVFYLMVDALNETSHEPLIVRTLLTLCGKHPNLRVLLTCTREPLEDDSRIFVRHMNNNAIDFDIDLYVENRLATEHGFQSLSHNIRAEIKRKVVSDADGTFRWAKMCMDRLSTLRTGRDVRRAMADVPSTLNGFYAGILARIPDQDRAIAREALMWLCFSLWPLRLAELAEAVVLEEGDVDIDGDSRLTDPAIILEICQGLAHANGHSVTLAHDSIRTFLQSDWIRTSIASDFALDAAESHRRIMRKCLSYLHLEPFSSGPVKKMEQINDRFYEYPLLRYATFLWPIHSEGFSLSSHDERLILGFFETKKLKHGGPFETWVQCLLDSTDIPVIRETEPVYYAASFNMTSVLQLILRPEYKVDVNKRGGRYSSPPLFVAIWRRNTEAAKLLVEAGANPDMRDALLTSRELAIRSKMNEVVDLMEQIVPRASSRDCS